MCRVWWSAPLATCDSALAGLDEAELARCEELRRPRDRARFVSGRVLARRALATELGVKPAAIVLRTRCPFCGGAHGKAALAGDHAGMIEFSIAHAGDRVVVATSRAGAVGVDVERIVVCADLASPSANVLAHDERATLDTLPARERDAAFMRYWTRKEAVLKATGDGLAVELSSLHVTAPGEPPAVLAWPQALQPRAVRLHDLDAGPNYRACLAVLTTVELSVESAPQAGRPPGFTPAAAAPAAAARRRSP